MDKKRTAREKRNTKRRISIIVSIVLLVVCVSAGGIGIWKSQKMSSKDTATTQSQTKDEKDNTDQKKVDTDTEKDNKQETWTVWTTDRVRLREKASGEAEALAVIPRSAELTAEQEVDGWVKVTYDGKKGYVSQEFIATEKPEEEEPEATVAQAQRPAGPTGGHVICIDPGHQSYGDSTPEPNGPGSATMKARVTGGTSGRTTGVSEYQLNLAIALQLQQELQARGYTVYMTRTTHDVNISNKERAEFATSVGAEITVRIHANGSDNTEVSGALALAPSTGNPYVAHLASASQALSSCVLNAYCAATGMKNQGVQANDTMTGINWCTMPVTILEMGYMTNPADDTNMQDAGFQYNMVQGIANGIDQYFGW